MKEIELPENVNKIIEKLEQNGFEGFAVGGCVRDSLLKKAPMDWDITTNAMPIDMKKIFNKTFDTGIAHGTITVIIEREKFELTTYRIDGDYSDGRHPDSVSFSKNLTEDLRRRDFTINAMAYSKNAGIIDLYGGTEDLKKGIIRAVGDAKTRFKEDALRMLRAVRFCAQLGFNIEKKTFDAIKSQAPLLKKVSKERIFVELNKALMGDFSQNIKLIHETGLYKYIGDSFSKIPNDFYNMLPRRLGDKKHIYWAIFLRDTDDLNTVKKILQELKSDKATVVNTVLLIEELKRKICESDEEIRLSLHRLGYELFEDYISIIKTDGKDEENRQILNIEKNYRKIKEEGHAISIRMLGITGNELMEMGIPKGPKIGEILNYLLMRVISDPALNNKESLSELVKQGEIKI